MKTLVSLSLVAVAALATGCSSVAPKYLNSGKILPTTLPFSEAVQVGNTLYLSGQIGNLPPGLTLAPGGIQAEAKQVMDNIRTSAEAHGYTMDDMVKCTVMLADMKEWATFNEVYKTYFKPGKYPARSAFGSNGLAFNARAEVECIAAKSG